MPAQVDTRPLPLPEHYDPAHAFEASYAVGDAAALEHEATAWRERHDLRPAHQDGPKVVLLMIDFQVDFAFPEGALFVAGRSGRGGMEAADRLARFVYRHLRALTEIRSTMDTHFPFQVFHPCAHLTQDGRHPDPNTVVSAREYRDGVYRANPAMAAALGRDPDWLQRQFVHYCERLEASGKYQLFLWPYHCLLGGTGHRLAGVIEEARLFHGFARETRNRIELKGGHPLTEDYSAFSAEVDTLFTGEPVAEAQPNTALMDELLSADRLLVGGLASSHCLKTSVMDLLAYSREHDPALARKVTVLRDCTAPVVVPEGQDFTDEAEQALDRFQEAGMRVVDSAEAFAE